MVFATNIGIKILENLLITLGGRGGSGWGKAIFGHCTRNAFKKHFHRESAFSTHENKNQIILYDP